MTAPFSTPQIAIPFFSGNGHTRVLAEAIAEGAGNAQPVDVETMGRAEWRALDAAQAIVFGAYLHGVHRRRVRPVPRSGR